MKTTHNLYILIPVRDCVLLFFPFFPRCLSLYGSLISLVRFECWVCVCALLFHIYRRLKQISIMFHINCLCFSQRTCYFLDKMHHRYKQNYGKQTRFKLQSRDEETHRERKKESGLKSLRAGANCHLV